MRLFPLRTKAMKRTALPTAASNARRKSIVIAATTGKARIMPDSGFGEGGGGGDAG